MYVDVVQTEGQPGPNKRLTPDPLRLSAQQLHARIEKLSSEIELQKELLKTLEREKLLVQRQLNAVLDPVARLPVEISSEIFLRSLSPFPKPNPRHSPILLLNICNAWTNIALSTPALWTAIAIVFPCGPRFKELLNIWLHRAGNRPLSISLRGETEDADIADAVVEIVCQHGHKLRHLQISEGNEDYEMIRYSEVDHFGGTTPGPFPLLKTLAFRCSSGRSFSGPEIFVFLRLAPNLVECRFHNVDPVYCGDDMEGKLTLSSLRCLIFGPDAGNPDSDDAILNYLILPGLKSLAIPLRYLSTYDLFAFLERSSPPLQELIVGEALKPDESDELHRCLTLVPTVTRFEIWWPDPNIVVDLFAALADSASLLPNLRYLTIHHVDESDISDSSSEIFIRALSARRTQLQVVRLILDDRPPPVDLLDALRELVADGMEIHIGTEERNYIVA
ncbi:F-box domain-containing protein [Mycena venus]|uniref:F-box domain-containing protein n=1 Tax=Mycena venus TaxID=2733690 RepID=A0A8H6U4J2_9AGAR|nr:F-box domain-containing protein [Mycena venus]